MYAYRAEITTWRERNSTLWRAERAGPSFTRQEPTPSAMPGEHLWGWKAIGRFMGMSVRSVQRWEGAAKLPIRRLKTGNRALPYAVRNELSAWVTERTVSPRAASELDLSLQGIPPFLQSFLDASTAHMAVLDVTGTIIAVNAAWRAFGRGNGLRSPNFGIGMNYFEICGAVTGKDTAMAGLVARGLVELLAGKRKDFKVRYRCDSATERRDFLLHATRFGGLASPLLVLAHSDITSVL